MVFGRKHRKREISETKLVLNNVELHPEQSVVYLGVTLDDQLKWNDHIMKLRSKCFGGLAKLRRLCKDLPMTVRKKLYCALIQPHTDYCSVVWRQLTLEQEKKVLCMYMCVKVCCTLSSIIQLGVPLMKVSLGYCYNNLL